LVKLAIKPTLSRLRLWDYLAAQRPDVMLLILNWCSSELLNFTARPAEIIYPPVETDKFSIAPQTGNYYLAGGRLVFYKRLISSARFFPFRHPAKIFGEGPELDNLRALAKSNLNFWARSKTAT
jgi:hypothetical protein